VQHLINDPRSWTVLFRRQREERSEETRPLGPGLVEQWGFARVQSEEDRLKYSVRFDRPDQVRIRTASGQGPDEWRNI